MPKLCIMLVNTTQGCSSPLCVSWISHLRSMLFDVQSILQSMIPLWDHQRLRGASMQIWKYILTFLISCLWICLSLLRKIKAYYDGKDHHTVLPLFRMYESIWCSVQLFRGIRRCRFNLMTCMSSQSCGADLSQPSGKLIVVPSVFLPRCPSHRSSLPEATSLPVLKNITEE